MITFNYDIPEQLLIGGHLYKILFPYRFRERTDFCGQSDFCLCEIRLVAVDNAGVELARSRLLRNLLTEIIRSILYIYHNSDKAVPNKLISALGNGLFQVLSDNPGFVITKAIPESIRIAGHDVSIKVDHIFTDGETDMLGRACSNANRILVTRKAAGGEEVSHSRHWTVVLHELIHCIITLYNADQDNDERIADALSEGMWQVWTTNPGLLGIKWGV